MSTTRVEAQPERRPESRIDVDRVAVRSSSRYPALFDPQTSGGLLLAVAKERASVTVDKLHAAGYARAAVIGEATEAIGGEPVLRLERRV